MISLNPDGKKSFTKPWHVKTKAYITFICEVTIYLIQLQLISNLLEIYLKDEPLVISLNTDAIARARSILHDWFQNYQSIVSLFMIGIPVEGC